MKPNNEIETRALGLNLHIAESRIHAGRQAIKQAVQCEPVDAELIEVQRSYIHEARLIRNSLRRQLDRTKSVAAPMPKYRWY